MAGQWSYVLSPTKFLANESENDGGEKWTGTRDVADSNSDSSAPLKKIVYLRPQKNNGYSRGQTKSTKKIEFY
jgi:hypothetical protein